MLAKKNNNLTLVLLHAFLEWVLILLLLLNSVMSYLIFRFADYFRLKRPCFWCSIDPLFHHYKTRDLVCDHHASHFGRWAYCSGHRKLVVDALNFCINCSSSETYPPKPPSRCSCCDVDSRNTWASLLKQNYELNLFGQKSGAAAAADTSSSYSIDEKGIFEGTGRPDDDTNATHDMIHHLSYYYNDKSSLVDGHDLAFNAQHKSTHLIRDLYSEENVVDFTFSENESVEIQLVNEDCDFGVAECGDGYGEIIGHDGLNWGFEPCAVSETEPLIDATSCCLGQDESAFAVSSGDSKIKHMKVDDTECHSIAYTVEGDLVMHLCRNVASCSTTSDCDDTVQEIQATTEQGIDKLAPLARVELIGLQNTEKTERRANLSREDHDKGEDIPTESHLLYRTTEEVPEQREEMVHQLVLSPPSWTNDLIREQTEETSTPASVALRSEQKHKCIVEVVAQASPILPQPNEEELSEMQVARGPEPGLLSSLPLSVENHSNNPLHFSQIDDHGSDQVEEVLALNRPRSVEATEHCLTVSLGFIQNEEVKSPDTPSSIDRAHNLYKSWLLLEKRESTTEVSLDGNINGDFENGEDILTVDKLKRALKVERQALHALYAELEEERNASAVAASQTMAMINRLQEEKALVQMEALQYQRVMEEQSDYDQEALQLLNELIVKKDKEKQELEKELEIYRIRVTDYETKERLTTLSKRKEESIRSGSSSVSCSDAKDTDGTSIDLKLETQDVMNGFEHNRKNGDQSTPLDDVLNVEESLSNFEEETFITLAAQGIRKQKYLH